MRQIRLACLLVLAALTTDGGGPAIAQTPSTAPTAQSSAACATRAKRKFAELMADYLRAAVATQGSANDYTTAPSPKVFAVCINWAESTPDRRVSHGFWFTTARFSSDPATVEQQALDRCANFPNAKSGKCSCQVVSRNGAMTISYPEGWAEKGC